MAQLRATKRPIGSAGYPWEARAAQPGAPPLPSKRDSNKREKQERIAQAARELFHEQGFAATTTQQIARRAGVASGTIFLYVTAKEDLLTLAFAREMKEIAAAALEALESSAPFADQVAEFFARLLCYHSGNLVIARELLREVGFLRHPTRDYGLSEIPFTLAMETITARGIANRELAPECDVDRVVPALFSFYWWALREMIHERATADECVTLLRSMIELLVAGIGRR